MAILRYITHPDVDVDPDVPVPEWGLSERGRQRVAAMLSQPWVGSLARIVCSGERKAREAADVLAGHLHLEVEVRPETGEIDRSSTGFVPYERHEALADAFFAHPIDAAAGWETAARAQRRIVEAVADLLAGGGSDDDADVAVVGHGGVGTLLWCHLSGRTIARRHDQPGQGHHWAYDLAAGRMAHGWRPIDSLER